ncbi:MAG: glycosyltransferase [Candidatus Moranbacteria bacterium]|nr:glycosyltransferase [Candidatus Moranbacteria bacterium]
MKILEINKFFHERRGAERHFLDVIDMLRRHGHEVEVFSMKHPSNQQSIFDKFFPSYVGYHSSDANAWQRLMGVGRLFWSFEARSKMKSLLGEWQPDIVHMHNIYHQLSPSILGPIRDRHIPIIMTVHDYNLISPDKDAYYPEIGKRYWKFLFMSKYSFGKRLLLVVKTYWNKWFNFYGNIDFFIAPSRFVQDVLVGAGMPREKIVVIPHFISGIKPVMLNNETVPLSYAMYFGSISEEKGVNDLVDIFDTLQIPLLIVGVTENNFVLRKSSYVTVIEKKTKQELLLLLHRASCVVSASSLPETFGLIALEAIADGKPFFGFRKGALTEIIENGKNGILVEKKSDLQQVLKKFFAKEQVFSYQEIQRFAYERFGEEQFNKTFERLCQSLIHKKDE